MKLKLEILTGLATIVVHASGFPFDFPHALIKKVTLNSNGRTGSKLNMGIGDFLSNLIGGGGTKFSPPVVIGEESLMSKKAHGTSATPVQANLRWGCDFETADRICNFNRHYAEFAGYWDKKSTFLKDESDASGEIKFHDSNSGKVLFEAPKDRSFESFVKESKMHGWPSFRDNEVNWDYVRVLPNGETISIDGTHLGHNLPDGKGNRYCINIVSVAGSPISAE